MSTCVLRTGRNFLIAFLAVALLAHELAGASDPIFDAKGFNPNREFVSELPFEHIDPMTGNLLLTYTDLSLPGNAGFDLKIQRTYNSKAVYNSYTLFKGSSVKVSGCSTI